ncbi:MAG TPA: hypothetical protein VGC58_01285 [Candidatus Paceibacterota bacterium]
MRMLLKVSLLSLLALLATGCAARGIHLAGEPQVIVLNNMDEPCKLFENGVHKATIKPGGFHKFWLGAWSNGGGKFVACEFFEMVNNEEVYLGSASKIFYRRQSYGSSYGGRSSFDSWKITSYDRVREVKGRTYPGRSNTSRHRPSAVP